MLIIFQNYVGRNDNDEYRANDRENVGHYKLQDLREIDVQNFRSVIEHFYGM